jgi:hypothetical protein
MTRAGSFRGTTPEGEAAMEEFGLAAVPLDRPGAPRPGRVADNLCDLVAELERATEVGDLGRIIEGVAAVRRLVQALDAWDSCVSWLVPRKRESWWHQVSTP